MTQGISDSLRVGYDPGYQCCRDLQSHLSLTVSSSLIRLSPKNWVMHALPYFYQNHLTIVGEIFIVVDLEISS